MDAGTVERYTLDSRHDEPSAWEGQGTADACIQALACGKHAAGTYRIFATPCAASSAGATDIRTDLSKCRSDTEDEVACVQILVCGKNSSGSYEVFSSPCAAHSEGATDISTDLAKCEVSIARQ